MQKYINDVLNMLNEALSEKFDDFHGLYLYGLFTDGKNHPNDDIEIAAIFDSEDKYKRELIWPIVGKIETELDVFIDLHPVTIEELKKDEEFYNEVITQGVCFKTDLKHQL